MRRLVAGDVTLEPQTAAHAEEMFAVLGDPAIYTYENAPPPSLEWLRERFRKLETRQSADGRERWLNWVIRIPTSELAGYVQATVRANGSAAIAFELHSRHWGRGLAAQAAHAMIRELAEHYQVTRLFAVAKQRNLRSIRLLERLGFSPADLDPRENHCLEPGEVLMSRRLERS
ncbi:MAG: N-acetyltransferase [Betaproteobacteria bacterium]|nr:MAG: N-acetyltransferase [Betaproteobacteria bacterium]